MHTCLVVEWCDGLVVILSGFKTAFHCSYFLFVKFKFSLVW